MYHVGKYFFFIIIGGHAPVNPQMISHTFSHISAWIHARDQPTKYGIHNTSSLGNKIDSLYTQVST